MQILFGKSIVTICSRKQIVHQKNDFGNRTFSLVLFDYFSTDRKSVRINAVL